MGIGRTPKRPNKLAVDTHFLEPGHIFDRDAKFMIIEKIKNTDQSKENLTNLLMRRENFWIKTLETLLPKELNTALNFPT